MTYAPRTSVSHLKTRAMVRYDVHIIVPVNASAYTGSQTVTGTRVTSAVDAAMPPRSAAMLMVFATMSNAQADHNTHRG